MKVKSLFKGKTGKPAAMFKWNIGKPECLVKQSIIQRQSEAVMKSYNENGGKPEAMMRQMGLLKDQEEVEDESGYNGDISDEDFKDIDTSDAVWDDIENISLEEFIDDELNLRKNLASNKSEGREIKISDLMEKVYCQSVGIDLPSFHNQIPLYQNNQSSQQQVSNLPQPSMKVKLLKFPKKNVISTNTLKIKLNTSLQNAINKRNKLIQSHGGKNKAMLKRMEKLHLRQIKDIPFDQELTSEIMDDLDQKFCQELYQASQEDPKVAPKQIQEKYIDLTNREAMNEIDEELIKGFRSFPCQIKITPDIEKILGANSMRFKGKKETSKKMASIENENLQNNLAAKSTENQDSLPSDLSDEDMSCIQAILGDQTRDKKINDNSTTKDKKEEIHSGFAKNVEFVESAGRKSVPTCSTKEDEILEEEADNREALEIAKMSLDYQLNENRML